MERGGCVYIISNRHKTVLYVGVSSDLRSRTLKHINKFYPNSFSARYNLNILVYYEVFASIEEAIAREKYLKGKRRSFKVELIHKANPDWRDLFEEEVKHW